MSRARVAAGWQWRRGHGRLGAGVGTGKADRGVTSIEMLDTLHSGMEAYICIYIP